MHMGLATVGAIHSPSSESSHSSGLVASSGTVINRETSSFQEVAYRGLGWSTAHCQAIPRVSLRLRRRSRKVRPRPNQLAKDEDN